MARRIHNKLETLPPELLATVDELLAKKKTYEQIAAFLRERGHEIGKSSVGRYHHSITAAAEKLTMVTEQLRPILKRVADGPNVELAQVASQMGLVELINFLEEGGTFDSDAEKAKAIGTLCQAAAKLQAANSLAERMRMSWQEKKAKADKELETMATKKGWNPEIVADVKRCYDL